MYYYNLVGDALYGIIVALIDGNRGPVFIQSITNTFSARISQVSHAQALKSARLRETLKKVVVFYLVGNRSLFSNWVVI